MPQVQTPPDSTRPLLPINKAASALGVSPQTVRRFIKDGRLPAVRVGHSWRVRPEDLDAVRERGTAHSS